MAGTLSREWATREDMVSTLATAEGQDRFLSSVFAQAAERRGLILGERQVYSFVPSPALTGTFEIDTIQVFDLVVSLTIAGQLHEQLRHKPPGWIPTDFRIAPEDE